MWSQLSFTYWIVVFPPQILFDQAQRSVQSALRAFLSGYVMPLGPPCKSKICKPLPSPPPLGKLGFVSMSSLLGDKLLTGFMSPAA